MESARKLIDGPIRIHAMFMAAEAGLQSMRA